MKFSEWWKANRQAIIDTLNNFFVKLLGGKLRNIVLTLIAIVDAYISMQETAPVATVEGTAEVMSSKLMGATLLLSDEKIISSKLVDFVVDKIAK